MRTFGEQLPNGAIVVACKPSADTPHLVVLANTRSLGGQPWVTWTEYRHPGERPATGNGHYFSSIGAAAADYESRQR